MLTQIDSRRVFVTMFLLNFFLPYLMDEELSYIVYLYLQKCSLCYHYHYFLIWCIWCLTYFYYHLIQIKLTYLTHSDL